MGALYSLASANKVDSHIKEHSLIMGIQGAEFCSPIFLFDLALY